jgi:hypothetical protein
MALSSALFAEATAVRAARLWSKRKPSSALKPFKVSTPQPPEETQ